MLRGCEFTCIDFPKIGWFLFFVCISDKKIVVTSLICLLNTFFVIYLRSPAVSMFFFCLFIYLLIFCLISYSFPHPLKVYTSSAVACSTNVFSFFQVFLFSVIIVGKQCVQKGLHLPILAEFSECFHVRQLQVCL